MIHQDITFVDESRYQSLALWCPLVDTDPGNGCLFAAPGSHRWNTGPRGPGTPYPYRALDTAIQKRLTAIPMRAGSAVIFCQKLFHASPPNRSGGTRVAVTGLVVPQRGAAPVLLPGGRLSREAGGLCRRRRFYSHYLYGSRPGRRARIGLIDYYHDPIGPGSWMGDSLRPSRPAPVSSIDLRSPAIAADPLPHYEALRRDGPVHFLSHHDAWIVLGFDEVRAAFGRPDQFSTQPTNASTPCSWSGARGPCADSAGSCPAISPPMRCRRSRPLPRCVRPLSSRPDLMDIVAGLAQPLSDAVAARLLGFDDEAVRAIRQARAETRAPESVHRALDAIAHRAVIYRLLMEAGIQRSRRREPGPAALARGHHCDGPDHQLERPSPRCASRVSGSRLRPTTRDSGVRRGGPPARSA